MPARNPASRRGSVANGTAVFGQVEPHNGRFRPVPGRDASEAVRTLRGASWPGGGRAAGRVAFVRIVELEITHPEKVLFPDDGITKGELCAYYEAVAPLMLPHISGRPITMERYPGGHRQEGVHPEERLEGISRMAAAGRDREARRRNRRRPLPARRRHALAALAREPELHHAARLDVAAAEAVPARRLRLRSGSVGGRRGRPSGRRRWRCAICSRSSGFRLHQDVGLEGLSHRGSARRRG